MGLCKFYKYIRVGVEFWQYPTEMASHPYNSRAACYRPQEVAANCGAGSETSRCKQRCGYHTTAESPQRSSGPGVDQYEDKRVISTDCI